MTIIREIIFVSIVLDHMLGLIIVNKLCHGDGNGNSQV